MAKGFGASPPPSFAIHWLSRKIRTQFRKTFCFKADCDKTPHMPPPLPTTSELLRDYKLDDLRPMRRSEIRYRLHYAAHYIRLALSVLRHG